jgi:hypothetical protein
LQHYVERLNRHELEQAAARMPCGPMTTVRMTVVCMDGGLVPMPDVRMRGVIWRCRVVTLMFTTRTKCDGRPSRLQGQYRHQ